MSAVGFEVWFWNIQNLILKVIVYKAAVCLDILKHLLIMCIAKNTSFNYVSTCCGIIQL